MKKSTRASRMAINVSPAVLSQLNRVQAAWYESPEEVRAGLQWGKRKAALLRWVRRQMDRRLTKRERRCLELYYFQGMTYERVGEATDTSGSSVCRAVQRALVKLRQAAQEDPSWRCFPRRRRAAPHPGRRRIP